MIASLGEMIQPPITKTAARKAARVARDEKHRQENLEAAKRQIASDTADATRVCCSSNWVLDVVYRGAEYPHTFHCGCAKCRHDSPSRLDPTPARESAISIDCEGSADLPDIDTLCDIAKGLSQTLSPPEVISKIYIMYPTLELSIESWKNSHEAHRIGSACVGTKSTAGVIAKRGNRGLCDD